MTSLFVNNIIILWSILFLSDMCKQVKAQLIDQLTLAEEAQQQDRPGSAGAKVNRSVYQLRCVFRDNLELSLLIFP